MNTTSPGGFRSLTARLVFWILGCGGLVFVGSLLYSNWLTRAMVRAAAKDETVRTARSAAERIDEVLAIAENGARGLADVLQTAAVSEAELGRQLELLVLSKPNIYGAAAAFEEKAFPGRPGRFAPYRHRPPDRRDGAPLAADLATRYDYREQAWYKAVREACAAQETCKPRWSEPYFDEGGGGTYMVTYSHPLWRAGATPPFRGVVTTDVDLAWLDEVLRKIRIGRTGFGVIFGANDAIIADPKGILQTPRGQPSSEPRVAWIAGRLRAALQDASQAPFERGTDREGRIEWMSAGRVTRTDWLLAVAYPEEELLADARAMFWNQLRLLLGGLLLLATVIVLLSRRLTRPLRDLAVGAAELGTGNLDAALPAAASRDEIGALAAAFHRMRDSLKEYVRNLQETTAARQRLESEAASARRIQMAMLPPKTAAGDGFELAAVLVPARSVGGDLYDHFVAAGRLHFMVGDVSGKGVPAALFMARTKTLFEVAAARLEDPGEILAEANRALSAENEAGMFVTVCCGILDIASGELLLSSGGHDAPILVPADGPARQLEIEGGPLLGIMDDARSPVNRLLLRPGDLLVAYSDGVSEALDTQGELLSIPRVVEALERQRPPSAGAARDLVLDTVRAHAAGADQSDDITILAIRRPPASAATTTP